MSAGKNFVIGLVAFVIYVQAVPCAMAASNRIHGVRVSSQGKATIVEITGERAPNFTTFKQDSPRRVIVDVAESDLGGVPGSIRGDGDIVSAVTTAQYGSPPHGISRFIIALKRAAEYRVTTQGGSLYVHITPGTGGLLVSAGIPVAPKHRATLSTSDDSAKEHLDLPLDIQPSAEADAENAPAEVSPQEETKDQGEDSTEPAPALVAMADRPSTSVTEHAVAEPPDNHHAATEEHSSNPSKPIVVAQGDDETDSEAEDTEDVDEVDETGSESDEVEDVEETDSDTTDDNTDIDDSVPVSEDVDDSADELDEPPPPAENDDSLDESGEEVPPPPAAEEEEEVSPPPPAAEEDEEEVPPPPPAASEQEEEEVPESPAASSEEVPPPPPPPAAATSEDSTQAEDVPEAPVAGAGEYSEVEDRVEVSGALKDMTWVGFQQTMEASRVFIKTNEPVKFHVTEEGDNLIVLELENTRIPLRNNTRFLDTHFFDSAVTMITPREIEGVSQNVRIEIQLRSKVPYTAGQDENMVYLDFRRQ